MLLGKTAATKRKPIMPVAKRSDPRICAEHTPERIRERLCKYNSNYLSDLALHPHRDCIFQRGSSESSIRAAALVLGTRRDIATRRKRRNLAERCWRTSSVACCAVSHELCAKRHNIETPESYSIGRHTACILQLAKEKTMLVKDLCTQDVATIEPDASIRDAAAKMADRNVGSLVVVNEHGKPTGMLTDRDIATTVVAQGLDVDQTIVDEVMAHPVVSIRETAAMEMALNCMTFGMRRVPVVDDEERLVGVVSLDDFLLMYSKEFDHVRRVLQKELHLPIA